MSTESYMGIGDIYPEVDKRRLAAAEGWLAQHGVDPAVLGTQGIRAIALNAPWQLEGNSEPEIKQEGEQ